MSEQVVEPARPLLHVRMVLLLTMIVTAMASFYLLLSVVPLYGSTYGTGVAGMSTATMMLGTVLVELIAPAVLSRLGPRTSILIGVGLLGVPALALTITLDGVAGLVLLLVVCLARGGGLGIVVVAGAALAAELAPAGRRTESIGLYGLASAVPSIVALPLGLWAVPQIGYVTLFIAAAVVAVPALFAAAGLPSTTTTPERHAGVASALLVGGLARPAIVFAATTLAAGVCVTFLPLAVPADQRHWAAAGLFAQSIATPLARWWAGRYGDRVGAGRLLWPALIASAVGIAALCWTGSPVAVIAGMCVFGIGFGVAQNVTLALMYERVPREQYGRASALWNLAFDGGMGLGAAGFGTVVAFSGYPGAFAITAAAVFAALFPALLDLRRK
ncbi:MFS transporter [Fodinicola acaciae]|uniref:MFS transporter n=1 Tax=Fodinicola acaciae TaxID=2681555 RepID=UPI001C9E7AFD|nr:MFS transporter [Fodinicola acaciae]